MTGRDASWPPFRAPHYEIGCDRQKASLALEPLLLGESEHLGEAFAAMNPWAAYGTSAASLATFFATNEPQAVRFGVRRAGGLAGVVVVRNPWLHGPYLHFLGLLAGQQGGGTGTAILAWLEAEAGAAGARNAWLCVSVINGRARTFYERHGYRHASTLDGLAADGMDEILMRKRLGLPV